MCEDSISSFLFFDVLTDLSFRFPSGRLSRKAKLWFFDVAEPHSLVQKGQSEGVIDMNAYMHQYCRACDAVL